MNSTIVIGFAAIAFSSAALFLKTDEFFFTSLDIFVIASVGYLSGHFYGRKRVK